MRRIVVLCIGLVIALFLGCSTDKNKNALLGSMALDVGGTKTCTDLKTLEGADDDKVGEIKGVFKQQATAFGGTFVDTPCERVGLLGTCVMRQTTREVQIEATLLILRSASLDKEREGCQKASGTWATP